MNLAQNASNSVSIGVMSLSSVINNNNNTAIGYGSLRLCTGSNNVGIGNK